MVNFIRPSFLGTQDEFVNRFEDPIKNGQCVDSTPRDVRLMRHRSFILHKKLAGFVHRRDFSVMKRGKQGDLTLPNKHEYVLFVRLSKLQKKLYTAYLKTNTRSLLKVYLNIFSLIPYGYHVK